MRRKWLEVAGIIALLVLFIVLFVGGYWLKWDWTGFSTKTLWDWLNLVGVLAIPVVVGFGAVWYTTQQTKASEEAAEQQRKAEQSRAEQQHKNEIEMAEKRHKTELEIAADNQRASALQAYIDKMSELLLEKNLHKSAEGDEVRNIARMRTLTVLRQLDPVRKGSVLLFLCEAALLDRGNRVIDLDSADLSKAELSGTFLGRTVWQEGADEPDDVEVDLSRADLSGANLRGASLVSACLFSTNLRGADLSHAFLEKDKLFGADLRNANLTRAFSLPSRTDLFDDVRSLEGATMPDGSKHP